MTKELKFVIRKRQNAFIKYGKNSWLYKKWRNKLQQKIVIVANGGKSLNPLLDRH
jgi:hypothetical protein